MIDKPTVPELLPCAACPWCSAEATERDEWGWLITHKDTCYWVNYHGDPIGRVRVNFSEVAKWNTRAAASTAPRDAREGSHSIALRIVEQVRGQFEDEQDAVDTVERIEQAICAAASSTPSSSTESKLRGALEVAQRFIQGTQLEHAIINHPDKPERTLGRFIREVLVTTELRKP